MKKELISNAIEKYRKRGLYSIIGFWIFSYLINRLEDLNLGFVIIVVFSGLCIVHTSAFYAMEKVMLLMLEEQGNE